MSEEEYIPLFEYERILSCTPDDIAQLNEDIALKLEADEVWHIPFLLATPTDQSKGYIYQYKPKKLLQLDEKTKVSNFSRIVRSS